MANELQVKRGTTALSALHTPLDGEPLWDNEAKQLYMGDGATLNGIPIGGSQTMKVVVVDSGAHDIAADLNTTDFTGQLGLTTTFIPLFAGDVLIVSYNGDVHTYIGVPQLVGLSGVATVAADFAHHDKIRTGNIISEGQIAMDDQGFNLGDPVIITGFTLDGQAILGYAAAATPAYTDNCNNATDQSILAGVGPSAWILVCSVTLTQDIVAGESIKAFWEVTADERGGRDGNMEIGYGVDGVPGGAVESTSFISSNQRTTYSGSTLVASTGYLTGQTLDLFIRATGSQANFDFWLAGTVATSKFIINIAAGASGAANATHSVQAASFSVAEGDGFDHYYAVTGAAVAVTIPAGISAGHRFSVRCQADTTFVNPGVTLTTPTSMNPLPFEDGAVIGFIAIAVDNFDMFGDLSLV